MKFQLLAGAALAALIATAPAARGEIVLGLMAPLTGPLAAVGAQIKNGAETAVEEINKKGGVNGEQLSLKIADDAGEPKQGVSAANQLVGEGVRFVVGPVTSGVAVPASSVLAENGVLMVTPTATAPDLTARGLTTVFRTCGRDDQQGEVAAAYIAKNFKDKKIAVIHDKTTYGQGLADETRKGLTKAGIKDVLYEGVNAGEKDFSALISKIKSVGADFVYWGGLHTEGGLIVRQMRDQGVKAVLISGDGITTDEFATIGGPGVEGTLMTFPPDPQKRPEAAAVIKKFEAKNFKPEAYTLYSYAAVQIMAEGAKRANSTDPKKISEALRGGQAVKTVIGDIAFDKKGDITRPDYTMYTWKKGADGKITYVEN